MYVCVCVCLRVYYVCMTAKEGVVRRGEDWVRWGGGLADRAEVGSLGK